MAPNNTGKGLLYGYKTNDLQYVKGTQYPRPPLGKAEYNEEFMKSKMQTIKIKKQKLIRLPKTLPQATYYKYPQHS